MADTKKAFLEGYASGTEKQKSRYKSEGSRANKPLLDEEKVTSFRDKLRNPGKYASADFSPDPYSSGTIKGASDMATTIEKEKEYKDTMDMVAKDKKFVDKKKGGTVKKMASGGKVSQLAKANGIAVRGKSRGTLI
jgi:hypothetical protein